MKKAPNAMIGAVIPTCFRRNDIAPKAPSYLGIGDKHEHERAEEEPDTDEELVGLLVVVRPPHGFTCRHEDCHPRVARVRIEHDQLRYKDTKSNQPDDANHQLGAAWGGLELEWVAYSVPPFNGNTAERQHRHGNGHSLKRQTIALFVK